MAERLFQQRIFFFGMVAILAVLAFVLVWPYIQAILLALALVVILKPVYSWFLNKRWIRASESRAAGITLLIFFLGIAIPAGFIVVGAISQAKNLFSGLDFEGLDLTPPALIAWLEETIRAFGAGDISSGLSQFSDSLQQAIGTVVQWLGNILIGLGQSLPLFFTNTVIVLIIMYVLLPVYKRPGKQDILEIVPFPAEITQLFMDKIDMMITAMFKGTFVIAIVQGLAMGLVLWIAGVPFLLFLTLLSMFLSLIPLIGISLVAWPVGILLLLSGHTWQGIFVIAAFILIVANLDAVLRPILVPKGAYLNPALIILSVLGGLSLMGIIGALYGPVIMILLVTSVEVYTKYMLRSDLEVLQEEGRVNLKELGLVAEENQGEQNIGDMFVTALKNISSRFRPAGPDLPEEAEGQDSPLEEAA